MPDTLLSSDEYSIVSRRHQIRMSVLRPQRGCLIQVALRDLAKGAQPAVSKAAFLARAWHARIELIHVLETPGHMMSRPSSAQRRRQQLAKIGATLSDMGIPVTCTVLEAYPASQVIARRAREQHAALLIVGQHEGRHVLRWLLRYTDWELLRLSPIPVLIVRSASPYADAPILAAVDPQHDLHKPASLDHSILDAAAVLTRASGGALHVVHAHLPFVLDLPERELSTPDATQRLMQEATRRARQRLDRLLSGRRIARNRRHLSGLSPAQAIRKTATEVGAGLVVMGLVTRPMAMRLIIGSTVERLADDLRCDLLVLTPSRTRSRKAAQRAVSATP